MPNSATVPGVANGIAMTLTPPAMAAAWCDFIRSTVVTTISFRLDLSLLHQMQRRLMGFPFFPPRSAELGSPQALQRLQKGGRRLRGDHQWQPLLEANNHER